MFRLLGIAALAVCALNVCAQTAPGASQPPTLASILSGEDRESMVQNFIAGRRVRNDTQATIRMLALDLAPFVKTLERDIVTYNYRSREEANLPGSGQIPVDDPRGVRSADTWRDAIFRHNSREEGMLGWGLYTATDPVSTQHYGDDGNQFTLTTLRYQTGSRMLDLRRAEFSIPMSEATFNRLQQLCDFNNYGYAETRQIEGVTYRTLNKTALTRRSRCHDVFVGALRLLGIHGLIYAYDEARMSYCNRTSVTPRATTAAFVAVDVPINDQTVDVFMGTPLNNDGAPVAPTVSDQDRGRYAQIVAAAGGALAGYDGITARLNVVGGTPDPADVQRWQEEARRETFNCDAQYAQQDAPHYNPNQVYSLLLSDGLRGLSQDLQGRIEACIGDQE